MLPRIIHQRVKLFRNGRTQIVSSPTEWVLMLQCRTHPAWEVEKQPFGLACFLPYEVCLMIGQSLWWRYPRFLNFSKVQQMQFILRTRKVAEGFGGLGQGSKAAKLFLVASGFPLHFWAPLSTPLCHFASSLGSHHRLLLPPGEVYSRNTSSASEAETLKANHCNSRTWMERHKGWSS